MRPIFLLCPLLLACRGAPDLDGDGYDASVDCQDRDPEIHPGAVERCNGLDDDCDGRVDVDAVDATAWYADGDGDGYGVGEPVSACHRPAGFAAADGDCDDANPYVNPGRIDGCDGVDDDCDGEIDEAGPLVTWFLDGDGDGFGASEAGFEASECGANPGAVRVGGDCDDLDPEVHPGADEVCNGLDDDCDGVVDGPDAIDAMPRYLDSDGDGFGAGPATVGCPNEASVANGDDCDDADPLVNPGMDELCGGGDENCDGRLDFGAVDAQTWYADHDRDGYGNPKAGLVTCRPGPERVLDDTDCDDDDPGVNPGAAEVCDGLDTDCDGEVDSPRPADARTWYVDADRDGHGDPDRPIVACLAPPGTSPDPTDCDDADVTISPDAREIVGDGVDQNCDGFDSCADLNCDGRPDLVLATWPPSGMFVYESPIPFVHEVFGGPPLLPSREIYASFSGGLAAGDFDGDGWLDVAMGCFFEPCSGGIAWGGELPPPFLFPTLGGQQYVASGAVGDLDGDGRADLVLANMIYLGVSRGPQLPTLELPFGVTWSVELLDLDGDGALDLVLASESEGAVVLYGDGKGGFPRRDDLGFAPAFGVAWGDFDGDGLPDLAIAHGGAEPADWGVSVLWGAGGETRVAKEVTVLRPLAVDLDGDGFDDLVLPALARSGGPLEGPPPVTASAIAWGGEAPFADRTELPAPEGATHAVAADLDGDGELDLVVTGIGGSALWWGDGQRFEALQFARLPAALHALVVP